MKKSRGKTRKRVERRSLAERITAEFRVQRKQMSVSNLTDLADDIQYWRSQSPTARLAYMEYLRLINYGQAAVSGRLKRILEITQRRSS